jgi:hypothetical protein
MLHVRSEVKLETFVKFVLFCFTKVFFFKKIPFSDELLDILHVVFAVWDSGA